MTLSNPPSGKQHPRLEVVAVYHQVTTPALENPPQFMFILCKVPSNDGDK